MQHTISSAFSDTVFTSLYPHSTISIVLHVLSQDGALLAACLNAATLALIDAGVPMKDYIAACGCEPNSTHYPTAAMSQMAFGSATAYGPACGVCFKLTLLNTFLSDPPFYPPEEKSIIVKITDLCPLSKSGWCNATTAGPNA